MQIVETAPHEFTANYLYNSFDLTPFFACDAVVKDGGGSMTGEFNVSGERWIVNLSHQSSNIVYPGDKTPQGTDWDLAPDEETAVDTLRREYRIKVKRHPDEDTIGKQDFTAHIAPRWPGMEGLKKDGSVRDIPVPDQFGEGINAKIQGSNIEFERYGELLRLGFDAVGVAGRYFDEPSPSSNILDAERYVRLHRDESGPVHARDGPLTQLSHLLENDRSGYRKSVQNDDDYKGRNLPGYYHTATLGPNRIQEAWPHHQLPKEIKHYYFKEAKQKSEDDPLAHPKLGASYQVSRWNETLPLSELERLNDELEEAVHSVLMSAGIDVSPVQSSGPYFPDPPYFTPSTKEIDGQPVSLNITRIKHQQESVVVRQVADGLSPVQWESVEYLVTDGGRSSPTDIAKENDRHPESVRRALREIEDLVDRKYNEVGLKSDYVAEMVHSAVKEARDSARKAVETGAKAMEAADRGMGEAMTKWIAWCERHGVDISNRTGQLRMELGQLDPHSDPDPGFLVRQAKQVWEDAKQDPQRFRTAEVRYNNRTEAAWTFL